MTEETPHNNIKTFNQKEYDKKYRLEHLDKRREAGRRYYRENKEKKLEYNKKRYQRLRDEILKKNVEWGLKNREKILSYKKNFRQKLRMDVLQKVAGEGNKIVCINCGCDDVRFLEVNHKNGGGRQELKDIKHLHTFYRFIRSGERKTDDLDIRCRLCNTLHYLERKYGEPGYSKIMWEKKEKRVEES